MILAALCLFLDQLSNNTLLLELCAYNIQSCLIAEKEGAERIELCSNPFEGGVTPSFGLISFCLEQLSIPVFPMIRPRGGNFAYDANELAIMKTDILKCKELGCKGIATGIHLADTRLDRDNLKRIVDWAYPMEVTCHKVFDGVPDALDALEVLMDAGCKRVLTSGLKKTAVEGAGLIKELIAAAAGRIIIMPGGGVRPSNIEQLMTETGATEYHSSGILAIATNQIADENEVRTLADSIKKYKN